MNKHIKIIIAAVLFFAISFIFVLKPMIFHENEYTVVFANRSEHIISSVVVSGAGENSDKLGPIQVGKIQDFIFIPKQDGVLKYTIVQNNREIKGVIEKDLKKGEVGEVFVLVNELYKIRVTKDFKI